MQCRSLRRHHRERLLQKRRSPWGRTLTHEEASRAVDTPTPCSCWLCGNPRRTIKELTLQETRANLALAEQP